MYEYGIHLPLAIMWPERVKGGRKVDEVVSFADYAPTFMEAAGLRASPDITGRSLIPLLTGGRPGARRYALSGRERHSHARRDNLGYPSRAIRTRDYLYIRNFAPERWPAGDPEIYADIDNGPTKTFMMERRDEYKRLFEAAFGKHPEEELFDIRQDPGCLTNLAGNPAHERTRKELRSELDKVLTAQRDPRMTGNGDIWESYPRFSAMRPQLGGFAEQGAYNPKYGKR
jgi:uncharacterized sulfatase